MSIFCLVESQKQTTNKQKLILKYIASLENKSDTEMNELKLNKTILDYFHINTDSVNKNTNTVITLKITKHWC